MHSYAQGDYPLRITRHATRRSGAALLVCAFLQLLGCAADPAHDSGKLSALQLFDERGTPRFSFYFSCAGKVSAETDLCWVPSRYFGRWAQERQVPIKEMRSESAFDRDNDVPVGERIKTEPAGEYRVVVRFAPSISASYTSENDGLGGYVPPKAGYRADIYVFSSAGAMLREENYHKSWQTQYKADAVPYVKSGVRTLIAAVDPTAKQASDADALRVRCLERPGRSAQACPADAL